MEREQLLQFAKIAETTYNNPGKNKFEELGYQVVKFFDRDGAQAYLIQNDSHRVLSFRGTEITQPSDVVADLKASKNKSESNGQVHRGFKGELDKIWSQIKQELDKGTLPLYITGHSLGAAMATLAAGRLAHRVRALITFGSPRVGNRTFVKNLFVEHYRVVNNNDAVTKVPLWIMGYRHHGKVIYLNYYGDVREITSWQRVKDMLRSRKRALGKLQLFKGVYDHLMAHYIAKLKKQGE